MPFGSIINLLYDKESSDIDVTLVMLELPMTGHSDALSYIADMLE